MNYRIFPPEEMVEARVALPPSKSIINRLLIINALAGQSPDEMADVEACDDSRALAQALKAQPGDTVNVGAAGTAMRFLTAYFAATPGAEVTMDGSERMRQRPIGTLVEALRSLGADIEYAGEEGFPPLRVHGKRLQGGDIEIDGEVSSQFISALAMIGPTMERPLCIRLMGNVVSLPYIRMTIGLMQARGIDCDMDPDHVTVNPGRYAPMEQARVEADWSAAAFWYELTAISSGFVTLDGLNAESHQGDSHVAKIFEDLGVVTDLEGEDGGIDLSASPDLAGRFIMDMTDYPDLVPAVVVTAVALGIPFRISGLASLRIKECDRVEALIEELGKIGVFPECYNNTLTWELDQRQRITELPRFNTHDDHRMAMALAPLAFFIPGLVIEDADVVTKSYPRYWDDLRSAGFTLADGDEPYNPEAEA